jgi:hypothetical protein
MAIKSSCGLKSENITEKLHEDMCIFMTTVAASVITVTVASNRQ